MPHAVWTPAAEADAEDIYAWIAFQAGRRSTAKALLRELRQLCDVYSDAFSAGSVIGMARSDLGDVYRVFSYKRWVVVFRPLDDGVEVLRVIDGSRDYTKMFES